MANHGEAMENNGTMEGRGNSWKLIGKAFKNTIEMTMEKQWKGNGNN